MHLCIIYIYSVFFMPAMPSHIHIIQHQHKYQHMYRIKRIADILKRLAVISLSPMIKPYRNQRQKRKSLLTDFKVHTKHFNRIHQTSQQLNIHPVKSSNLPQQTPPFPFPEKIENENCQYTCAVIVNHT